VLNSLLERGLLLERPASEGEAVWRKDEESGRFTLVISAEGLRAIGIAVVTPGESTDQRKVRQPPSSSAYIRPAFARRCSWTMAADAR
jgi:hypothetical protein